MSDQCAELMICAQLIKCNRLLAKTLQKRALTIQVKFWIVISFYSLQGIAFNNTKIMNKAKTALYIYIRDKTNPKKKILRTSFKKSDATLLEFFIRFKMITSEFASCQPRSQSLTVVSHVRIGP
jgi:hypothetical protein